MKNVRTIIERRVTRQLFLHRVNFWYNAGGASCAARVASTQSSSWRQLFSVCQLFSPLVNFYLRVSTFAGGANRALGGAPPRGNCPAAGQARLGRKKELGSAVGTSGCGDIGAIGWGGEVLGGRQSPSGGRPVSLWRETGLDGGAGESEGARGHCVTGSRASPERSEQTLNPVSLKP